ncbi:MAG: zinc-dependent peptidase [Myxococcales bacterium]|nr:MAG: zinc-dependent peptidase [Myxococcales bacterium]
MVFAFFREWRRRKVRAQAFPNEWEKWMRERVPYVNQLSEESLTELRKHILVFVDEKNFEGAADLQMTDEIRVTIAAQACILLLGRKADYFPGLQSIVVYPRTYIAKTIQSAGSRVYTEQMDARLGESSSRGAVVLVWDAVKRGAADIHDGHNVVFHEFAHQLDQQSGDANGAPILEQRSRYISWARVLSEEFERLQKARDAGGETLLDTYGAKNPAEFFAVATEHFFEQGRQLKEHHPKLYEELKNFYHQDPACLK